MPNSTMRRFTPLLIVLAIGFVLGGTFATAKKSDSPQFQLDVYYGTQAQGTLAVEDGHAFVDWTEEGTGYRAEVIGWKALEQLGVLRDGQAVSVDGMDERKHRHRGHVTVLK
jgi:hypothetical protein